MMKITEKINAYTARLGVSPERAFAMYLEHGTCLKGLRTENLLDDDGVEDYLKTVHDVDLSDIEPAAHERSHAGRVAGDQVGSGSIWQLRARRSVLAPAGRRAGRRVRAARGTNVDLHRVHHRARAAVHRAARGGLAAAARGHHRYAVRTRARRGAVPGAHAPRQQRCEPAAAPLAARAFARPARHLPALPFLSQHVPAEYEAQPRELPCGDGHGARLRPGRVRLEISTGALAHRDPSLSVWCEDDGRVRGRHLPVLLTLSRLDLTRT